MAIEILMPALSPTMEEGTLAKWLVKEGDEVKSGDLIAEIETDKATMEFEAVEEGIIGKILVAEGTEGVKVKTPICTISEEGEDMSSESAIVGTKPEAAAPNDAAPFETTKMSISAPVAKKDSRLFATPLARRIAKDKFLDLATIDGSGPHGRIIKADVENLIVQPASVSAVAPSASTSSANATIIPPSGPNTQQIIKMYEGRKFQEIKLDGMRKIIASRLTEAKQTVPHFYLRRDIELDTLLKFRTQLNKTLELRDIKLSVNDFIIKACALALQQIPEANAVWAGDRVLQMTASDVAVAVAIKGGLFTPVLQDAEVKSLSTLSAQMKDLAARARDRKLLPHEYQGGSFAISNLGMFGIDNFDAIINPPHSGILAVGAGTKKPVVNEDGKIKVATVMSTTLSVDHRVIDGAMGANLLNAIKNNLENPMAMLA
ncbi:MAG: pyruvate dehydrogenase complex dihydrolipoamide acetyltransferase [Octadecabacter sp.]|nr:pyruvate dehydrogenase complex dihydrolipoamide acetyltransferase [Octadecabacter sp.]